MSGSASRLRAAGLAVVAFACLGLLVSFLSAGTADAAGDGHVRIKIAGSAGFTSHPVGPLVDTTGLVPGRSARGTMGIRNGFEEPSDLFLKMIDVANDDNGCTHAESAVDQTCGAGQGDLTGALVFRLAVASGETGIYSTRWTGSAAELERGVPVAGTIAAGGTRWMRLSASLPFAAGNQTQSDQFTFGVRVVIQNIAGVEGIDITVHPGGTPTGSGHGGLSLAVTGTRATIPAVAGVLLVAGGLLLLAAARIRRRAARG